MISMGHNRNKRNEDVLRKTRLAAEMHRCRGSSPSQRLRGFALLTVVAGSESQGARGAT